MRQQWNQFSAVAQLTVLESVRQPIYMLLTTACLLLVGLFPVLITYTLDEGARLIRDCALALQFVAGLVLGSFTAAYAISRDIRRGTATVVLSKPVGRALFFLAKFCGVALALVTFSALLTIATALATRTVTPTNYTFDWWGSGPLLVAVPLAFAIAGIQNYFSRCTFTSRATLWLILLTVGSLLLSAAIDVKGAWGHFGSAIPWRVFPAGLLIALAILVLAGFATSLATRLEAIPVLTISSTVLLLGLVSDYMAGQLKGAGRDTLARVVDLLPNWQNFWLVDALNTGGIPPVYIGHAALYAALYLAGLLAAGIFAIQRMEIRS